MPSVLALRILCVLNKEKKSAEKENIFNFHTLKMSSQLKELKSKSDVLLLNSLRGLFIEKEVLFHGQKCSDSVSDDIDDVVVVNCDGIVQRETNLGCSCMSTLAVGGQNNYFG